MKARYVEHTCPKCQAKIGRSRLSRTPIGKPFVVCWTCQEFVPCPPFNEWDFLDPHTKMRYGSSVIFQAFVFGLIPGLMYGVADVLIRGDYDLRIFLITLGAGLLVVGSIRYAAFSAVVRRSHRRVADPMYQAKLVEFGIETRNSKSTAAPTPSRSNPTA